ncbi:YbaB/EbfC family nucleoid-associated protein [Actinocatenispora rupis]|uniref:YbaB/EbfC DNA-binding family protein n=1 Tax=Actinocatenispora rupis TaxID=519421 RepID=A0A8J3NG07_9ACTN|nr:YbaB/EbfC family nucleoid-associated protein [Actinocatenispora rupis]GID15455.1 hypothetical protein Aru02nite_63440 [Actinocatenispora rupis]
MAQNPMPDLAALADRIGRIRDDLADATAEIEDAELTSASPDGAVRATVRRGRLVGLVIEPAALEQDAGALAAQVLRVVRDAEDRAGAAQERRLVPAAEQMRALLADHT